MRKRIIRQTSAHLLQNFLRKHNFSDKRGFISLEQRKEPTLRHVKATLECSPVTQRGKRSPTYVCFVRVGVSTPAHETRIEHPIAHVHVDCGEFTASGKRQLVKDVMAKFFAILSLSRELVSRNTIIRKITSYEFL